MPSGARPSGVLRDCQGFHGTDVNAVKKLAGDLLLGAQGSLTALGERIGWQWLIYNPVVYYGFERAARRNAPLFAQALQRCIPGVERTLDVGCGTGEYVAALRIAGVEAIGVEYSQRLRRRCVRKGIDVYPFDLAQATPLPPGAPFDLAYSLEVAEHVSEDFSDALVAYLARASDRIVFTAAQPGQGGTGHINEQPREYWVEKFHEQSRLRLDADATSALARELRRLGAFDYLASNLSVFRRRPGG
jgi:SAM-dependent methyltransferase